MTRFLLLTWPGAGNQVPAAGLADELTQRGHTVIFAGYEVQRERFEQAGFGFRTLKGADSEWPTEPPPDWMPVLAGVVWASAQHLGDVEDVIAAEAPEVLVVDCLMFAALAAARRSGLPTVALVHSAPGAMAPPGGPMEAGLLGPINGVREAAGFPAVTGIWELWCEQPALVTSIAELDPLASGLPAGFDFVGPITEQLPDSGWQSPWPETDRRPFVVAAFSSGWAWDQTSRIQRTIDALAGRCRLLISTGFSDPAELRIPSEVAAAPFIPHAEVLPLADVVISHAGHGTVTAALAHGVPLVSLANLAADQPAMAAQVAALGAGIALDGDRATADEVAAAVGQVQQDQFRTAAARLADVIAAAPGRSGAADRLEGLAGRS